MSEIENTDIARRESVNNKKITDIINMIIYIKQKVDDLPISDRKNILKMIVNSGIDDCKIHSKGSGTQIKFKDIPQDVISNIYEYIYNKDLEKIAKLNNFTEENFV